MVMDEPHPPPPTPVTQARALPHTSISGYPDTFLFHSVEAEVHPDPSEAPSPSPPPPHVPNGPLHNGPYIIPNGPYFLRNGPGTATVDEGPLKIPALTTFGRVPAVGSPPLGTPRSPPQVRQRPLDPRVEELRGQRPPKVIVAPSPLGRNGFCRPRKVTFLVEPVPEAEEDNDDDEDEELSSLHQDDDDDVNDDEDGDKLGLLARKGPRAPSRQSHYLRRNFPMQTTDRRQRSFTGKASFPVVRAVHGKDDRRPVGL